MSPITERPTAALADRYRIERELGQGSIATVYLAEDLKRIREVRGCCETSNPGLPSGYHCCCPCPGGVDGRDVQP